MIIHQVQYEWVERIFGTFIADHYNQISFTLTVIGLIIAILCGRKIILNWPHKIHRRIENSFPETTTDNEPEIFVSIKGEWSETGWYLDEETGRWEPPDYLREEARTKWKWDEEKRIWIDLEKQRRIEKHQAYLASTAGSREPTYEEWKAQRLKEKENEDHPVS